MALQWGAASGFFLTLVGGVMLWYIITPNIDFKQKEKTIINKEKPIEKL